MDRVVRRAQTLAALGCLLAFVSLARGQEANSDLAAAYSQAMAQFQAGQYAQAAGALEAITARVEVSPQVEPIFYTIGSAWFNAGDYTKAIAAFKNYLAKFPQGPHAGGAAFAIAQSNFQKKNYQEAAAQMAALERDPKMRAQALLFEAQSFKAAGKTKSAIGALEKLIGQEITDADGMRGATILAQLYAAEGNGAKALQTLQTIHQKIELADNIIELNALTVDLGPWHPRSASSRSFLRLPRRFISGSAAAFTSSIANGKRSWSTRRSSIASRTRQSASRRFSV